MIHFTAVDGLYQDIGGDPRTIPLRRIMLQMTEEFCCETVLTTGLFRAEKPTSMDDLRQGRFCTKTGQWGPGHAIVRVAGLPYLTRKAPYIPPERGPRREDRGERQS